ncbi:MAG: FG-GAP-like repeat-containing protein, partial [Verrucomicrobiota bacterium]
SVSPASGVSTGNHQATTVSYTTAGLPAGVYQATLKVAGVDNATGEATTNGPLYMGLNLTVKGTAVPKTDVTSLSQTLLENLGGTSQFSITNEGSLPHGSMSYTVTPDVNWVTVSPTTGVITNEAASILVQWDTGVLSPMVYTGNLTVSAAGTDLTIPLTLTVMSRTPVNWELPSVAGIMYVGQTVEANVGLWTNQARLTFGYQWERASNKAGDDCEVLSGAVASNYVITTSDRGKYLRVNITATDPDPSPKSSTMNSAWVDSAKVKALRADFNGDGITDLWFYDELSGTWYISFGGASSAEGIFPGGPGMVATPGDYDGDGNEDVAVFERAHGMWHILFLWRCEYLYGSLFGGTAEEATATPMPADYDGDAITDVAFYWMGYWAILYSSLGSISVVEPFANAWGTPVTGDWDGDGIAEMGVYDDGVWTLRMGDGSITEQEFGGGSGVLPAPADYDADGATDLGVYDVGANQWRWRESRTGFEQSVSFGLGGIVPIPGYYDHDCSNDWAQAHISADNDFIVWEVKRTTETNFPYRGQSLQQSTSRWRVSW